MLKRLTFATVAVLLALPALASAKDLAGRFGIGYFNSDAPVGLRYWFSPKAGVDLGIGYELTDLGSQNANNFWLEVGIPYVVLGDDRANFFIRPGIQYAMLDDRAYGLLGVDDTWNVLTFTIAPGAEVFFGDHFSLEASHGFGVRYTMLPDAYSAPSSPTGGEDTLLDAATFGRGTTELGFHFYF